MTIAPLVIPGEAEGGGKGTQVERFARWRKKVQRSFFNTAEFLTPGSPSLALTAFALAGDDTAFYEMQHAIP